ncbi:hypothetical protein [Nesterenkonia flava]|uniref:Uncharacterized protein n=1 Tax=Nesterenkonia flava TaxID=469799 RepID=A0ABU1FUM6_9MICC|nr:hypothetical protein [Nesterenkonia flava]MDR5712052.1 hypothetical protein [Nesterenkonia flava]
MVTIITIIAIVITAAAMAAAAASWAEGSHEPSLLDYVGGALMGAICISPVILGLVGALYV